MNKSEPYLGSPDNPKTGAVVCYITLIGWLIARFAIFPQSHDKLTAFHLRQTLLLHLLSITLNFIAAVTFWPTGESKWIIGILGAILLVMWLIGLFAAVDGKEKAVPVVGPLAQKLFKSIR